MLDIQGRKYASVTVCDVTLYDLVTKYPVMYFDTLKVTTLEGTAEVTDIQGGQGNATLASVSHSKAIFKYSLVLLAFALLIVAVF